ncbi:G-type lectin S-receptor-like serine/threonine-protein kinase At1g11300 [Solanum dulcamara]|uniref:G-type lectin S-receptor-like serine/threonine-protein kinase At1g11300 n=1 Tax=Solanum dulcamara TaxID=45834 RepID=UPI00248690A2|nr:G-type lectin S-receptor-like serine/threonine-protein kinase At1g11300 [Solanum dulcamara]
MNQHVVDGQTVVSAGGIFELGFFSPNGSQGRYVGSRYKGLPVEKVAWVANRKRPLIGSYGVLMINASDGNLFLVDDKNMSILSTETSLMSNNTVAVLTDQGNLVLCELNKSIGLNTRTGEQIVVTSWKDEKNPSLGRFSSAVVDRHELLQVLILNGSSKHFRSGQWNRRSFIGVPSMTKDHHNGFQLLTDNNGEELYFSYAILNYSAPTLIYFDSYGAIIQIDWDADENKWLRVQNEGNRTSGCVRRAQFQCEETITSPNSDDERNKGDVFLSVSEMKLPDFSHYLLGIKWNAKILS